MKDQFKADLDWLLKQSQFQRAFAEWMQRTKIFGTTFTGNDHGIYLEGNRAFVMDMFIDLLKVNKQAAFEILKRTTEDE